MLTVHSAALTLTVHWSILNGRSRNKNNFQIEISIRFSRAPSILKFGAPSLQRNSRPAGWAESSSVIPVSLCRFLSKQPWNLSGRRASLVSVKVLFLSAFCELFHLTVQLQTPCISASSSSPPRLHTHTEAPGQGSYCAELGFKGTEPRTLKHTHTETEAYTRVTSPHGPGIPWQRKLARSPTAGTGAAVPSYFYSRLELF